MLDPLCGGSYTAQCAKEVSVISFTDNEAFDIKYCTTMFKKFINPLLLGLALLQLTACSFGGRQSEYFSFRLMQEPHTLDPQSVRGPAGGFLFSSIYLSLYKLSPTNEPRPHGGTCQWHVEPSPNVPKHKLVSEFMHLRCKLFKNRHFSDGTPIKAQHYINSFKALFLNRSTHQEHLLKVAGAREFIKTQKSFEGIQITSPEEYVLEFQFSEPDPEFTYKLVSRALAPRKWWCSAYAPAPKGWSEGDACPTSLPLPQDKSDAVFSGPYKISTWNKGRSILLRPNAYFAKGNVEPHPSIKVRFVADDSAAINLFEQGELSFLRRLPLSHIDQYKNHKGFKSIALSRFDYIGFGQALHARPKLREALAFSLDYEQLKKLFKSPTPPGCPSFDAKLMAQAQCLKMDLTRAKKAFKEHVAREAPLKLVLGFSAMGGASVRTSMEWMQNEWQKNLGTRVELKSFEQSVFLKKLIAGEFVLFRKGGALHRPTCLSAMERFSLAEENYIKFSKKSFEPKLRALALAPSDVKKASACSAAVQELFTPAPYLIPLGQIHYATVNDGVFDNFFVNALQNLDVTGLRRSR